MTTAQLTPSTPAHRGLLHRRSESAHTYRLGAVLGSRLADMADHPAGLGQATLLATGFIVIITAPTLGLSDNAWLMLGLVSIAMIILVLGSARVQWSQRHHLALLVFPASVIAALLALGLAEPGTFSPLTGLLVFVFAFLGLTQPAGTSLKATPFAGGVYLVVNGQVVAPVLVRLLVAVLVWVVLGELLVQMTARRRTLTEALEQAANCDALTGLDNRRVWDRRLQQAQPGTTVVICDLDHFKSLNDTYGHGYGDEVLTAFSTMLLTQLRPLDCCARYGGEEFALLLTDAAVADATAILARLHQTWATLRPGITFSAGLAACRQDRTNLDTLRAADIALYEAKHGGRDTDRVEAIDAAVTARKIRR